MRIAVILTVLVAVWVGLYSPTTAAQNQPTEALTLERIFSAPDLTTPAPQQIKFAPSGVHISYLAGSVEQPTIQDLWLYDVREDKHQRIVKAADLVDTSQSLSAEEQARRERLRVRASGIIDYYWAPDSNALLFPVNGQLYLYDRQQQRVQRLTSNQHFATDARFSPQGRFVSYVHNYNLYVIELASGETHQLTARTVSTEQFATAEFVAQEEMKRMTGYWWSPNEAHLVLTRIDLSDVPIQRRVDVHGDRTELVEQPYPAAGDANVAIDLGLLSVADFTVAAANDTKSDNTDQPAIRWFPLQEQHGDG